MGQYTSRINNPPPPSSSSSSNHSSSTSPSTTNQSPQHESTTGITNLRRRRSSTNYTPSHLPASRRRRLPRLNESIRFWNRRASNNHSTESLDSHNNNSRDNQDEEDTHRHMSALDIEILQNLSHSSPAGNNGPSIYPSNNNSEPPSNTNTRPAVSGQAEEGDHEGRDSLDVAGFADLASDIFSSRSNHHSYPRPSNSRQHSSFSSIPSGSSSTSASTRHTNSNNQRTGSSAHNDQNNNNAMSFEHQTEMLSRLLEIAATSTVMNLMGSSHVNGRRFDNTSRIQSSSNIPSTSNNGDDSNFQEFVSALRHGLLTNELSSRYSDVDLNDRDNMTFFRAFRFDSENTATGLTGTGTTNGNDWPDADQDLDNGPFGFGLHDHDEFEEGEDDSNNMFGSHYHHNHATSRGDNANSSNSNNNTNNNSLNNDVESPNVPVMIIGVRSVQQNASDGLSTLATGSTSSNGASATTATTPGTHTTNEPEPLQEEQPTSSSHQSSGSPSDQQQQQQRSWVIFVMGNTFAWNHPLLSAPSLMSENPTYEDLLNLQELIGQVKPQVTTKEELFKHDDQLFKVLLDDATQPVSTDDKLLKISQLERCQICLSEYDDGEVVRKLSSCNHFYHKDCVDNWLLNGKNNCPLCRSKGIVNPNGDDNMEKDSTGEGVSVNAS